MRWPRARLARAGSHGEGVSAGGYAGYQRPSLSTAGRDWRDFFTGDDDAVDSLREHAICDTHMHTHATHVLTHSCLHAHIHT